MENAVGMAIIILAIPVIMFFWFRGGSRPTLAAYSPLVIDGDTIFWRGKSYRIHGIDAPEVSQAGGEASKHFLARLMKNQRVTIEIMDIDRYGRSVSRLHGESGDIGRSMVENGYARAYFHEDYRKDEARAKRRKRGLWAARGGMPDPAGYRREKQGKRW